MSTAKTTSERVEKLRKQRAALQLKRKEVYVHDDDWPELLKLAKQLESRRAELLSRPGEQSAEPAPVSAGGPKDGSLEEAAKALTGEHPLSAEQRALLLSLVATKGADQSECDRLREEGLRLVDAYRERFKKPSNAGMRADAPLFREFADFNASLRTGRKG